MTRPVFTAIIVVLLASPFSVPAVAFGEPTDDPAPKKVYELPKDGTTPVLEMDYKGGFTPPRKKQDPALTILADGTVLMPDRFGTSKDVSGKISVDEIQSLLRFVLDEKQFAKVDPAAIKQAVQEEQKKNGRFAVVADAASVWVKVHVDGGRHEAQYYALSMAAGQHPTIESLQNFNDISIRLQQLMNITRGGGEERVAAMLKLANAELAKQHEGADPLEMEHLGYVATRPDGSTHYSFRWHAQGMPGVPATATYVNATVVVPEQGEPTVTINAKL